MAQAKSPDEVIDAEFWQKNDTGYDGVRGYSKNKTGYDGIRGAAIRGMSNAAGKRLNVDPRAIEAAASSVPNKGLVVLGVGALLFGAMYLYNNPETVDRLLGSGDDD